MLFIHDDFLLTSDAARRLYHSFAKDQPIIDFHNHLSPQRVAENQPFKDLYDLWLAGDHYKWRAMRANGVAESLITGNAPAKEKFQAWAGTVPRLLRNPLYHWTHLELARFFAIDECLDERSADDVWNAAAQRLQIQSLTPWSILEKFRVRAICTTDDPADDLTHHRAVANSRPAFRMFPTFRPDAALGVDRGEAFCQWLRRLEQATSRSIESLDALLSALAERHAAFHAVGCRLSDHGLPHCYADDCNEATARAVFQKAVSRDIVMPSEASQYRSFLMLFFGRLDTEAGWTKQLHLGASRNNNSRLFAALGADCGADSIGDWPQANLLGRYLDRLDREGSLPKMIVYNLNPADNYAIATMLGNFQAGPTPSKLQLGSGWWFLDQDDGIRWQLDALSQTGLLAHFVGMVTDSRSFMSFPRHEYFRRVLCDLLGRDVESGKLPNDESLLGRLIGDICYGNASRFFGFEALPS